jgi:lipopolysaccharide transport system ATP-binding protein
MADTIISVEQLGKKYQITHQVGRSRYKSLGETITFKARDVLNGWRFRNGNNGARKASREEFWALKDVSFEVREGEVLGIIGRNGAGKSTLLKILSRITEPTDGRVRIRGRVASLLEVGTGFHPELTGRENIYLNGAILGMTKAEIRRKFDEIVAFSEVENFLDTPVKRFSSGMYVRLAFAVAAHLEPEILIVDEVLAVGDTQFQKKCLGKMHDVSQSGRTVLFVSHNMPTVLHLTSRSILLSAGSVIFDGPTEDAIARYADGVGTRSATFFDVENTPRNGLGTGAVQIIALWFDRAAPLFEAGEDFEFAIRLRAVDAASGLVVCLTVFSSDGTPVGSSFGPESIALSQNGRCDVSVKMLDLRLAPGHYYCSVGIAKGNPRSAFTMFDGVLDTLPFVVLPETGDAGTISAWFTGWGHIRYPRLYVSPIAVQEEVQS